MASPSFSGTPCLVVNICEHLLPDQLLWHCNQTSIQVSTSLDQCFTIHQKDNSAPQGYIPTSGHSQACLWWLLLSWPGTEMSALAVARGRSTAMAQDPSPVFAGSGCQGGACAPGTALPGKVGCELLRGEITGSPWTPKARRAFESPGVLPIKKKDVGVEYQRLQQLYY